MAVDILPGSDGLPPADQAKIDFEEAISMADGIADDKIKGDVYLNIARSQAQAGLEPVQPPDYFIASLDQIEPEHYKQSSVWEKIALLQADMGDVDGALESAEDGPGIESFARRLAAAILPHGGDPRSVLDVIFEKLELGNPEKPKGLGRASFTVQLQQDLGLPPQKDLLDKFRQHSYKDPISRNIHLMQLAKAYADAGFPDDALEVWGTTSDSNHHPFKRTRLLAEIAISQAENGTDPSELITRASNALNMIKAEDRDVPSWQRAKIYAKLAEARGKYELDSQPMVDQALAQAQEVPYGNLRSNAYLDIARAQLSLGIDARLVIGSALEAVDSMTTNEQVFDMMLQVSEWRYVFELQLKARYFVMQGKLCKG